MIKKLLIKNIGLIDELEINFKAGLNIFTGETGAGKSMIINSVSFLMGKKMDKSFIKKNCDRAIISANFILEPDIKKIIYEILAFNKINIKNHDLICISREYINGKIINKINDNKIKLSILRQICCVLIEFHGQNQSQMLFDNKNQLNLLDKFCDKKIIELKKKLKISINKLDANKKIIDKFVGDTDLENKIMLLEFKINEISHANLIYNEEEKLKNKYKILSAAKNTYDNLVKIINLLYENDNNNNNNFCARSMISQANNLLFNIKNDNQEKGFCFLSDSLNSILINLDEIKNNFLDKLFDCEQILESSAKELNLIETRLDFIYDLKSKYKKSVNELIDYLAVLNQELINLKANINKIKDLESEQKDLLANINNLCEKISLERKQIAKTICDDLEKNFLDLSMPDMRIKINFLLKNNFDLTGYDNINFLISSNLNQDFRPIEKIASGGEISRIMLAFENVFAQYNNIPVLVFDEIDSGISGYAAQAVAEKLNLISQKHQVICITHLAQISAMADTHFLIKKISDHDNNNNNNNNNTQIKIYELSNKDAIIEIARILSGKKITDKSLETAKELKLNAKKNL